MRVRPRWLALVAVAAMLGTALPAAAGADAPAVTDCTVHLRLTHHYTVAELQSAIATMSATVREYTSCSDVLQQALNAELAGHSVGGGSGGSGGSFLPLPLLLAILVVLLVGGGYGVAAARRRRTEELGDPAAPGEPEEPRPG
jgi:hypothetical protein